MLQRFYKVRREQRSLPTEEQIAMASEECERLLTKPLSVEEILGVEPQREPIRGPPLNRVMEPGQTEEVEVYTDGSCAKNACLMDQAGYGVFFPASGREIKGRVCGAQTAQRGEVCAVARGAQCESPPLHRFNVRRGVDATLAAASGEWS